MTKNPTGYLGDVAPNNLEPYWMPFTWNRHFKKDPLFLRSAEGMYYESVNGKQILDGTAGLWCCNAGHRREKIVAAVQEAVSYLDYAPSFQISHPVVFELAQRLTAMIGPEFTHAFFCNSGSEAVDSALKIALAYHRVRGEGQRTRLIGRSRAYHGVGFGGISVGGIVKNRMFWGPLINGVDHLPHTYDHEHQAFSKGQPEWGAHLADELENILALHDPSTVAAVIVEPVAGSTGVLIPPKGYLQKLRAICDRHGILLIFDEVITGFGRLGTSFATDYFDVKPDLITLAKGLTNGVIPMGAVVARKGIYETFMEWADATDQTIELFHGYTYSGHPVAAAAALATIDTYQEDGLLTRGAELAQHWEDALHSLKGTKHVKDLRNIGLIGAIELDSRPGKVGARAYEAFRKCFEAGVLVRVTADIIALSPPLIIDEAEIDRLMETIAKVLTRLD